MTDIMNNMSVIAEKTGVRFLRTALLVLTLCLPGLFSCSGGEGGTGHNPDISIGTITGFGSIFVNGIEFDTTSSSIEGDAVVEADLRIGMQVRVNGSINSDGLTGVADSVIVKEVLRGPVSVNDAANRLTVMGQIVEISPTTVFTNAGISDITGIVVSDVVEVSGFFKSSGVLSASRIEVLSPATSDFKVYGEVHSVNVVDGLFMIGTLMVDHSSATFSGVSGTTLMAGDMVEVKGSYSASLLTASRVEKESLHSLNSPETEIEGYVTLVDSPTFFRINNIPVQVDINTAFKGGTSDEIFAGLKLEAEGPLVNGVLHAEEIEFEEGVRIESDLAVVSIDTNTGEGSLSVKGVSSSYSLLTNSLTDFDGALATLAPDQSVRLRGVVAGSVIHLTRVEVLAASNGVSLQGPVTAVAMDSVDILGVNIPTGSIPDGEFTKQGEIIGQALFFNEVSVDKVVKASGVLDPIALTIEWTGLDIVD